MSALLRAPRAGHTWAAPTVRAVLRAGTLAAAGFDGTIGAMACVGSGSAACAAVPVATAVLRCRCGCSANAQFDAATAGYRGQVPGAFRDVEDQLSALRLLAEQAQMQDRAVTSARGATALSDSRWRNRNGRTRWHDPPMTDPLRSPDPLAPPEPLPGGRPLSLLRWCWEGLRAACFQPPRVAGHAPRPWQVLAVVLAVELLGLGLSRLWIVGPADFWPLSYLASWWWWAPMLWAAWWALSLRPGGGFGASAPRPQGLGSWVLLASLGPVPGFVVMGGAAALLAHGLLGAATFWTTAVVALQWLSLAWALAAAVVLMARFSRRVLATAGYAAALAAVMAVQLWVMNAAAWSPPAADEAAAPELSLSQEVFEDQQAAWDDAVDTLAPERPGVADVYGLVFAPYAAEDVFRRESTMVAQLLRERFDAQGRVLQLLNHADTAAELPWATPLNLERAIDALARHMDLAQDVLVVYMTSHGGGDFRLAAYHGPLAVESVTPQFLRAALDRAGIRHRVIAISACYSGGWVEPLATPGTLVMTAADADHTSYGCGHRSPMTFFGRAVFDEQLRQTHDFGQAFAAAVPVIKQREEEAGKSDGFSNPQIRIGEEIAPVLRGLQQRLDGAAR